jgi:hypothetical protein
MGFIKTNFTRPTKMVLVDDSDIVMAIIDIPSGEDIDITDKVVRAIKDHLTETLAIECSIVGAFDINEFGYELSFGADCLPSADEDDEESDEEVEYNVEFREFTLYKTEEY